MEIFATAALLCSVFLARAQTTWTDNFSTPHNYLTEGVAGTMWDGVYLGANAFDHPTSIGMAAGQVFTAAASNGVLSVTSLQTDWEMTNDDGFFLYKVISGDFDMSVEIGAPVDSRAHNFPGLMVRNFGPQGAPAPDGAENFFIWGRFNEYSIANMLKNNTAGAKRDRALGTYPNTNYWVRVQRVGNLFNVFEKAAPTDAWNQVGSVTRTNFTDPLQVGIEHADFDGGRTLGATWKNFSLTASNEGPFAAEPAPAKDLHVTGNTNTPSSPTDGPVISWTPGQGSDGSMVVIWTGDSSVLTAAPANGISYPGQLGGFPPSNFLPAAGYSILSAGLYHGMTAAFPLTGPVHFAIFSYTGTNKSITYSHTPARFDLPAPTKP